MTRSLRRLPILILLAIVVASAYFAAQADNWDAQAARNKAAYIFLEAQNALGTGNYDTYEYLIDRAFMLDSTDIDIAAEWGLSKLSHQSSDSLMIARAYNKVRRRFLNNPSDYTTGVVFSNVAQQYRQFSDLVMIWETLDSIYPTKNEPAEELAKAYIVSYILGDSAAFDKALDIYARLESGAGRNVPISSQKIRAFMLKNDTAAVIAELDSLYAHAPTDCFTAYYIGSNYEYLQMPDKALRYLNLASELDSTFGPAYMARASLYMSRGDSAAYDREVFYALRSQNLELEPKLEILKSYVSQLYSDKSQEPRLRALFAEMERLHPGEVDLHSLYSSYLYAIKDYEGAKEEMSYATGLDPANEGLWSSLVQVSVMARDTTAAMEYTRDAMSRFPDNLYFPIAAADFLRQQHQLKQATALLDSVVVKEINNPDAVSNFMCFKADILAADNDTARAFDLYDQAIKLNPNNYLAMNNAAYFIAEKGGDLDKAERYSNRAVMSEPDNPTYLDTYAWVFFKKKDYSMARQYIDMTLNIYNTAATDTVSAYNPQDVVIADDTAPAEETPSVEIYEHAGDIYFMNGEPDRALDFWEKALALDPSSEMLKKKVKHKTYFFK